MANRSDQVIERLATDGALREAVGRATSPEEVVRVLAEAGLDVSPSDVVVVADTGPDVSDADLSGATGGVFRTVACMPGGPTQVIVVTHCYPLF